jgi:hypothetical protein
MFSFLELGKSVKYTLVAIQRLERVSFMGSARILGCAMNVEKQAAGNNDVLYTVSGEGAEQLHKVCASFATNLSELREGSFSVTKNGLSDVTDLGDTPVVIAIREGMDRATREKQL